jgi:multidrug efflux pump subunit AcrB
VPVSLIGTFAGLLLLGYSINTLTLFGMVLAIGIVVDDAIVVLENVERIMHEEHLHARDAAIQAMQEVTSPIIASCWCCARCSCRSPSWAASPASCTASSRSRSRSRW